MGAHRRTKESRCADMAMNILPITLNKRVDCFLRILNHLFRKHMNLSDIPMEA
jgi:hypothetical protein